MMVLVSPSAMDIRELDEALCSFVEPADIVVLEPSPVASVFVALGRVRNLLGDCRSEVET
jgi:hypothetical protein